MKKQKSLRDVSRALDVAAEAIAEIERRALYENPPELSFEQKVIAAARGLSDGHSLQDFLTSGEIEQTINTLADVYAVTGVKMPDDWY